MSSKRGDHGKRRKRKKSRLWLLPVVIISVFAAIAVAVFGSLEFMRSRGKNELHDSLIRPSLPALAANRVQPTVAVEAASGGGAAQSSASPATADAGQAAADAPLPADADVVHNGKAYKFNDQLVSLLILGVDKQSEESDRHQADAVYLVVLDEEKRNIDVIAISRNIMTDVRMYGYNDDYIGTQQMQLCLAYSYGGTDAASSELTMDAVSGLFYGLPIQGYYTLFMDAIPIITDAVGGVDVTIGEDLTALSPDLTEGAQVNLRGDLALKYLRYRKGSNEGRMALQSQFIKSFVKKAFEAAKKDPALPLDMYNTLADCSDTNISASSAVYLASVALSSSFGTTISLSGTEGEYGGSEAVYVDENALYELILKVFYKEIK